jgi:hypothetical protein
MPYLVQMMRSNSLSSIPPTIIDHVPDGIVNDPESTDYEQYNFAMLNVNTDDNNSNYMINPDPAVFTNARRVEVTLMKILVCEIPPTLHCQSKN